MTVEWPKTADGQWYLAEGQILIPVDGKMGAALIHVRPAGGMIAGGMTAIVKGDPGDPFRLYPTVNVTELEYDDPTPAAASWSTITPPSPGDPGEYAFNITVHKGKDGADGNTVLDPADFGGGLPLQMIRLDADAEAFELADVPLAECKWPAVIEDVGSGNPQKTMATIAFSARPWARVLEVSGYTVVAGEGPDVRVDLVARLGTGSPGSETSGSVIARCTGIAQTDRLQFSAGPGAGTADAGFVIPAGTAPIVYIRTERQAGSLTYTAAASTSRFMVKATPVR